MDHASSLRPFQLLTVLTCLGALVGMASSVHAESTGWPLYVASCLWAVALTGQGILMDSALTLASAAGEERSWVFALKSSLWRAGALAGQLMNAAVFSIYGDEWSVRATNAAMYSGLAVCSSTVLLLLLSLRQHDEEEEGGGLQQSLLAEEIAPSKIAGSNPEDAAPAPHASNADCCGLSALAPQWVIFYAVIMRVVGKGMAMRFTPIVLTERFGLSPLQLTSTIALAQLLSIPSPMILTYLATIFGRAQVTIVKNRGVYQHPIQHTIFALEAIILPFLEEFGVNVPKKSRSRWNALESINRGSWAGTAAFGGFLVQHSGYTTLYLVAAGVILLSVLIMCALIGRRSRDGRVRGGV
ncbi:hypothetical protein T492DRAFT_923727 [Pavlovales sp. CCMP2436]|nr:hypothetical protein T492DRAFT_923727 [Pavlovales sp. CCMP2436]